MVTRCMTVGILQPEFCRRPKRNEGGKSSGRDLVMSQRNGHNG